MKLKLGLLTTTLSILAILICFNANIDKSIIENAKINNTITQNQIVLSDNSIETDANAQVVSRQRNRSGVVIEATSRRVLIDEGMNIRCFPASTTKVLTALCVLKNLDINHIVTIPKLAEGVEGSSLYLKEGQKMSVEDLLYGMMLRSGNDAAVALAIEVSGSVEDFATLMNKTAKELGACSSHFVNPHGLHDDNHYTTAYDLSLITAKSYEYEYFRRIVDTRQRKILVDNESVVIQNKNKLLRMIDGANGVKTGFTKTSGRCLVGGAKRGDMQLISVVLNYNDMWNDTIRMLETAFNEYEMVALDKAMLMYPDASDICVFECPSTVYKNYKDVKYPLKRDGSERLQIVSGK